ncbi:MAG: IclR family transcriptional regulator C-terminal domain-containing protein, partial [Paracoccaceae bacterium]|nr:IclR family transcriptional regulator C-terminal domain-containing protein [Paracoccaceae bacterium]
FGFVEQVGPAREYRLGPQVLRLAALREAAVPMREAAMPVLRALTQTLGETVHLSVVVGEKLQMLGFAYSASHAMAVMMEDADTLPYHATSSGLAVLAFAPDALRERVLSHPLPRLTGQTVTDPATIRARLIEVRAQGFAQSAGGFEADVSSLAAPLFDATGQCCGALALAAPGSRMTPALQAKARREITRAAAQITGFWGGAIPPDIATLWQGAIGGTGLPSHERATA